MTAIRTPTGNRIELTPQLAKELRATVPNSAVDQDKVRRYAKTIRADHWRDDGRITLSANGTLVNGKHRCHAVLTASQPITVELYRAPFQNRPAVSRSRSPWN
jgi:hypothetical protein